jgi:hypothetical protein
MSTYRKEISRVLFQSYLLFVRIDESFISNMIKTVIITCAHSQLVLMESRFRKEEKWRNKVVERGCKLMVMVGTGQKQVSHETRQ